METGEMDGLVVKYLIILVSYFMLITELALAIHDRVNLLIILSSLGMLFNILMMVFFIYLDVRLKKKLIKPEYGKEIILLGKFSTTVTLSEKDFASIPYFRKKGIVNLLFPFIHTIGAVFSFVSYFSISNLSFIQGYIFKSLQFISSLPFLIKILVIVIKLSKIKKFLPKIIYNVTESQDPFATTELTDIGGFLPTYEIVVDGSNDDTDIFFVDSFDRTAKCPICKLTIYENQNALQCRYCLSIFHEDHLLNWLKTNLYCPVCQKKISK